MRQKSLLGDDEPVRRPKRRPAADVPAVVTPETRPASVIKHGTKKVGRHRGGRRVFFEGQWLAKAGFSPGDKVAVLYDKANQSITVALGTAGDRLVSVSQHRGVPVIDLSNVDVSETLGHVDEITYETVYGKIVVRHDDVVEAVAERRRERNKLEGSVFSGAGFLTLAAEQGGYESAFAIEKDEVCQAVFEANHPAATMLGDVTAVTRRLLRGEWRLPHVDLLTGGIPCQAFSHLTRLEREEGEDAVRGILLGMTHFFLTVVQHTNPYNIVVEEVEDYLTSNAHRMLESALTAMGYHLQWAVLDATDFGLPTGRKRAVIVATTDPAPGLLTKLGTSSSRLLPPRLGDFLLPPGLLENVHPVQGGWFTARDPEDLRQFTRAVFEEEIPSEFEARPGHWLPVMWERDKYPPQFVDDLTRRIQAIVSKYGKPSPNGPFIVHPYRPDTYRLLTVDEIKRLHGVPEDYRLTGHYRTDVDLLGRGVVVDVFRAVIEALPGRSRRSNPGSNYMDAAVRVALKP